MNSQSLVKQAQSTLLKRFILALAIFGSMGMSAAIAAKEPRLFYGFAFDEFSGKYLYTEVHQHLYEGDKWLSGSVRYFSPDNRLIGEKILDFSKDPYIPLFRLKLPTEKYEEAVSNLTGTAIELERLIEGKQQKTQIERQAGMVADAGFNNFILDHLSDIAAGKTAQFAFVVAGQLDKYSFRLKKAGDGTTDGHPTLKIKGEPDSLLRYLFSPLQVTYDLQTKTLLEYRGTSNLHDPDSGKTYSEVRIIYPAKPPAGAPSPLPAFDRSLAN
jgi:uncharacterized protein (DUF2147 family)